ncbi:Y1252-like protein [Mya arenaria]|uniref:Y1252-like protein n=1 Tax=Mya arenaria TaxID=6604 RepID=A0ABY7FGM2_MYAAR|nr:Y1252-like protein [Mya arenaria]
MQVISVSDIYNLQILQNRNTNEKLLDFLRTHIDVIPHTHVVFRSDEKEVFFGCKDEQSLRIFVSNLQNLVFKREFNIADGECREMIKALQTFGQMYILCSDQETVHMLCTQRVIKQLDEHMQCIFQVRLLPLQVEYFASFGKIKVQELGLENGLQIYLNKGNKTLTFRGKRCDIKAMDDRLKTYFQLKKIKIALPRNILPTFEETAVAAASEQQCCYSINWRSSAEKGPGNRLIASLKSKDGNGVTLIQGRLFDLDVDAVVILANTSMSPRTAIAEEDIEPHMLEVHIRNGTLIPDQKADISVNTTGKSLQLEKGGALSRSIVLAAGVQLQDELSKEYPGGLNEGQIAVTSSGKLSRNGDIKAMVKTCLAEADKLQGKSIALPPFGTGRHGYPIRKTALAMFEAIDEFSEESAFISAQSKESSSPDRKKINNAQFINSTGKV